MSKFDRKEGSTKGTRTSSKRTICEVHRQLYDILYTELARSNKALLDRVTPLLDEAFGLGIGLVKRLVEYKCSMPHWESNYGKEEVARLRRLREQLKTKLR